MSNTLTISLGKYGKMRLNYLKDIKPSLYKEMVQDGTLTQHLQAINERANDMMDELEAQLKASTPPPPAETPFMIMVQYNDQINRQAEEIVLSEVVWPEAQI